MNIPNYSEDQLNKAIEFYCKFDSYLALSIVQACRAELNRRKINQPKQDETKHINTAQASWAKEHSPKARW